MNSRLLFLLVIAIIGNLQISESFACECESNRSYADIVDRADLVFIGTVSEIANLEDHKQFVLFDVHSVAKGEMSTIQITTSESLTSCSVDYDMGVTYSVVVHDKERMSTGMCSTVPLEHIGYFKDIPRSLLDAINEPEVPDCGPNTVLTDGVCMVIDGGCEPDINGDTTWCGPQYDYLQIILSEPSASMFAFGTPSLIGGIIIGAVFWRKRRCGIN